LIREADRLAQPDGDTDAAHPAVRSAVGVPPVDCLAQADRPGTLARTTGMLATAARRRKSRRAESLPGDSGRLPVGRLLSAIC